MGCVQQRLCRTASCLNTYTNYYTEMPLRSSSALEQSLPLIRVRVLTIDCRSRYHPALSRPLAHLGPCPSHNSSVPWTSTQTVSKDRVSSTRWERVRLRNLVLAYRSHSPASRTWVEACRGNQSSDHSCRCHCLPCSNWPCCLLRQRVRRPPFPLRLGHALGKSWDRNQRPHHCYRSCHGLRCSVVLRSLSNPK